MSILSLPRTQSDWLILLKKLERNFKKNEKTEKVPTPHPPGKDLHFYFIFFVISLNFLSKIYQFRCVLGNESIDTVI